MILGLSVAAFTQLHTIISLIGIATGLVFLVALLRGRRAVLAGDHQQLPPVVKHET